MYSNLLQLFYFECMNINRTDVLWNYGASFIKISSSLLLLPFVLKHLPAETVGIWVMFVTVNSMILIFDFGFNPSFARSITYIFSGMQNLKRDGFYTVEREQSIDINYGLLKNVIKAMQWFYYRAAAFFLVLMATAGTGYLYTILENYKGSHTEVYTAWAIICFANCFNLASLFYDCLLQGKGLIKKYKQILAISQLIYLITAVIFLLSGMGLIAIAVSQVISILILRLLSHKVFFTASIKKNMMDADVNKNEGVLNKIYPNAIKSGAALFGIWMAQRSAIIIGSFYLPLPQIASYGISMQIVSVFAGLSGIYAATYQPKTVQMIVKNEIAGIKKIYLKGLLILLLTFVGGGLCLLLAGNWILAFIGSKTSLLPPVFLVLALLLSFEQSNFIMAANILSAKNKIPFYKSAVITGAAITILLMLFFCFFKAGLAMLFIIPLLADFFYQAWKWPLEAAKDLKLTFADITISIRLP